MMIEINQTATREVRIHWDTGLEGKLLQKLFEVVEIYNEVKEIE